MKVYEAMVNSIKRGMISPVYLFYGPDHYFKSKSVAALKKYVAGGEQADFNLTIMDGNQNTLDEVLDAANTLPFFADRKLLLVENAPYFKNKRKKGEAESEEEPQEDKEAALLSYLQEPNPTTCLVFLTDEGINTKKKVYKALEKCGQALEFAQLKNRELEEWARQQFQKRGKKVDPAGLYYLLSVNSNDLGILAGEIEKLSLLNLPKEQIGLEEIKLAASSSVEASIFDLVDCIGEKRTARAIELLREMLGHGEPAPRILAMIGRQVRLILATKSLGVESYAQGQISSALGVHPYVAQKLVKQAKNFSNPQLVAALESCLEADLGIKTGQGAPGLLLELAILSISNGRPLKILA